MRRLAALMLAAACGDNIQPVHPDAAPNLPNPSQLWLHGIDNSESYLWLVETEPTQHF